MCYMADRIRVHVRVRVRLGLSGLDMRFRVVPCPWRGLKGRHGSESVIDAEMG